MIEFWEMMELFGVLIVVAITQFYANIKTIELYTKNNKVYINFKELYF